ncbi:MAG: LLM class flavin-dependent oxidoreductase [Anaerolineae bacterium]|nr:LLM class flavin-dependent oxidoreductase [Anaerolineae bacterium]
MNYGHRLKFGTFITPSSRAPDEVVALAQRSEALGFDLVTFQDHPYQPALLDTWTLLSWVAGKTERIHLAANVLNVPLRAPAMLARSAASLDRLSNGRLDLALGAGYYWEAIRAMGGRKLTPGESVDALSEAIDIIRGMLDVASAHPLRYAGRHYLINGAQQGPVPARDIPIWLGAYKPRMLQLTGQKADGWVVTHSFLKDGDLKSAKRIIDEAALEAGRDPREVRRMLNISGTFSPGGDGLLDGPPARWVEGLLPLIVEDGVSTLILMTDDEPTMEQFTGEVMPALREAVNRELGSGWDTGEVRSTRVRAKRRAGLDYDALASSLAEIAVEPGDVEFVRVKSTYMRGGSPAIVFRASSTREVVEALAFARAHSHLPLAVRSGGHGISGRSTNDGGIVIDLSRMNAIDMLDQAARLVRIEAGARWMEVAAALEPYGWALSSGDYGGVGVGGLATAGGIGWLARQHGLTIDHLRAVEIVLADGAVVRANEQENADLFWAVRGAGANFGIVTAFEFEVDEVSDIGWAQLVFDASDIAGFLEDWGAVVEASPRDLTSFMMMGGPRRGQPIVAQVMAMVDSNDPETIINRLQPLANTAPLVDQNVVIVPYSYIMANAQGDDHDGRGEPTARSGLIRHITPEFAAAAERMLRTGAVYFFQIRSVGGAVADVAPDATAYAHRSANFSVTAFGVNRERFNALWEELYPHFEGLYLSFETDQRLERLHDAFPPATLERLRALKRRYDPDNVFRDNFNITGPTQRTGETSFETSTRNA